MTRLASGVLALAVVLARADGASAHRLDEYLQAMRVDVRPDGVALEVDLTPGANLAPGILGALDPDGDGAIEVAETDAYVREVMRRLEVTIDGRPSALGVTSRGFPSPEDLRAGTGVIRLILTAQFSQTTGSHRMLVDNRYRSDVSVYLANTLRPGAGAITIASQRRDPRQQTLTIDYVVGSSLLTRASASWAAVATLLIGLSAYWRRRQPRK